MRTIRRGERRHARPDWTPRRREEDSSEDKSGGPDDDRGPVGRRDCQLQADGRAHRAIPHQRPTGGRGPATRKERGKASGTTARELMSSPPVTIGPEANVRKAAKLMHERRIKRLPVVDGDGRLLGVISRSDAAYVLAL